MLRVHESLSHCRDTVLRYAVMLQVCTHAYCSLCEVRTEFSYIFYIKFVFQSVNTREEYGSGLHTLQELIWTRFFLTQVIVHRDGKTKGYDSLHAHISPKILPTEYGGEAGSILDMWGKKTFYK